MYGKLNIKSVSYKIKVSEDCLIYHNQFGPAFLHYKKGGNVSYISFDVNGVLHNNKGPTEIIYHNDIYVNYHLNGKKIDVSSYKEFKKYINRLNIS